MIIFDEENESITFSYYGRIEVYNDKISIGLDGSLYYGYDGELNIYNKKEALDLADYMIERWKEFKEEWNK